MKECLIFFTAACVLVFYVHTLSSSRENYYLADYDKIPNCECSRVYLNQNDV